MDFNDFLALFFCLQCPCLILSYRSTISEKIVRTTGVKVPFLSPVPQNNVVTPEKSTVVYEIVSSTFPTFKTTLNWGKKGQTVNLFREVVRLV